MSVRPASQATRFFGSLESTLAPPAKPKPLAQRIEPAVDLDLGEARRAELELVDASRCVPSDRRSLPTFCTVAPPSVIASTLSASFTGHDGRSALPSISPNACTAASGSRRGASGRRQQPVEIDLPRRKLHLQSAAARRT